ncbi:hypothetical protein ACFQY8_07660 [Alloscardovia venturai]|uniref:Primase C-terminal 1 domain-containing protein n=1 Tax=Alloscardovia venturai TaxID=1769421 RepID=A0ABW2Y762_9BIFI
MGRIQHVSLAWKLTEELSLRDAVRVYTRHDGVYMNATRERLISRGEPLSPWAMYLADGSTYQYVCFDLDAHDGNTQSRELVQADCEKITTILDDCHIAYLVCESGPSGGRHIWISMVDSLDASLVRKLAYAMKAHTPSLDITPLLNPVTGCVRPPYSPHRNGGQSKPIQGSVDCLLIPTVSEQDIWHLIDTLASLAPADTHPVDSETSLEDAHVDSFGLPYLPGIKRELPKGSQTALNAPVNKTTDTSKRLWVVVLGAVRAHWHIQDLMELVVSSNAPGLTHAKYENTNAGRVRRPKYGSHNTVSVLKRMWVKAYQYITSHETQKTQDFDIRLTLITAKIENLYTWNNARTIKGIGQAVDQRVMNTLLYNALKAVNDTIQLDSRRIALTCGISHQTASMSLRRLEKQGHITLTKSAHGVVAHTWHINTNWSLDDCKNVENTGLDSGLVSSLATSGYTPPENYYTLLRNTLLSLLETWLNITNQDACTHTGLGISQGNQLATSHASSPTPALDSLYTWLEKKAHKLGTHGLHAVKTATYMVERTLWTWWVNEVNVMQSSLTTHRIQASEAHNIESLVRARFPRHGALPDYKNAATLVGQLL